MNEHSVNQFVRFISKLFLYELIKKKTGRSGYDLSLFTKIQSLRASIFIFDFCELKIHPVKADMFFFHKKMIGETEVSLILL